MLRTDGRTTYGSNTALALRASRGKTEFVTKPITPSYILPQIFRPGMHFQRESPNTAVTRPVELPYTARTENAVTPVSKPPYSAPDTNDVT